MTADVVAFEPRPKPVPAMQFVELRLGEDCSIEMKLFDDAGNVVILEYSLALSPEDFDLDRLREAWDRWRGFSEVAS